MMIGGRLLGGALLTLIAVAIGAAPARADGEIGLSTDGAAWTDVLSAPLFDRPGHWVPGDVETRSFYVRNEGPSDARLTVSLLTQDPGHLVSDDDVALSARVAASGWTSLRNGQDVAPLVRDAVGQGREVRVDVRAAFRWESPNASMVQQVPLRVVVTLRQDGPLADGDSDDGPDGTLPDTGSLVTWWVIGGAVLSVALGVVLVVLGRRRQKGDGR